MPTYDYLCDACGPFTNFRPMAECDEPDSCPHCAADAPRAFLSVPYFSCMPVTTRTAHAANEKSRNAPMTSGEYKAKHGAGCGCCKPGKAARLQTRSKSGVKGFPTARPWMISH